MHIRYTASLLLITVVQGLFVATAAAQPAQIDGLTPQDPVKFSLFEEENWYLLADEPGLHIARARDAFLMMDTHTAATQLRKAAVHLRIAASDGTERTKRGLKRAQHELEKTADRIEAGTLKSIEEFDLATTHAMHSLSEYHYWKAAAAWEKKEVRKAGHYLRAAADNVEHAAARTEQRMKMATAEVARESRIISSSMIEGTGYAVDEVGVGFEKIGNQIERVGHRVAPTMDPGAGRRDSRRVKGFE